MRRTGIKNGSISDFSQKIMFFIKRWLVSPVFPNDEIKTRRANLLNSSLINITTLMPMLLIGDLLGGRSRFMSFAAEILAFAFCFVLRSWMYRGRIQLASIGLITMGLVLTTAVVADIGSIRAPTTAIYLLIVITGGFLFGLRGMMITIAISSLLIGGLTIAENAGLLQIPDYSVTITQWIAYTVILTWTGSLTFSSLQVMRQALERADKEIIDRKKVEDALRVSEAKYRSIFENVIEGIYHTTLDGQIITVNTSLANIFGYKSRQEFLSKITNVKQLYVDPSRREELMYLVKKQGAVTGFEAQNQRKEGNIIWVSLNIRALHDADNRIIGLEGTLLDITERKRAEDVLRKSHEELEIRVKERTAELGEKNLKLEAEIAERKQAEEKIKEQATLLDNAQEAIGVRNLEDHIIYWNKGAQRLYGWTTEEAIGKNPVDFLFKDKKTPQELIEAKKTVLEKGEWIGELNHITKDGLEVIVESHWTLIYDNEGKPKSILFINNDITQKKMFEAHLLRTQRMESIGTLAGGLAHDLNNMLTPIMMSLHMLKNKFKDEQSQKLLSILERNTQRSADLIKQVLSFARGVEGDRNPLQVKHIITEIDKIIKETFPRSIEIRTEVPKDLFSISGDATQLHQVIMNLCVNARDAMPNGGILNITASNFIIDEKFVRMHADANVGTYIAITVSDTGIGIPPKIIDRIFEPFFTTKEFGKGTGLGLSTALAVIKSHNGFINVYSEVGKGTIFRVYLPAIKTEILKIDEQKFELPTGHGEFILVAEDEESVREVTISTLKEYGYNVLVANNGADAVTVFAQNKNNVDVVLMDMMMPVMDGETSIREIRRINSDANVIVVSGLAEKDKLSKIESTRAQALLPKPYTTEKLLKTIHDVLGKIPKREHKK